MVNLGKTICALLEHGVHGLIACFEFRRRSEFLRSETQRDVSAADHIDRINGRSAEFPDATLFKGLVALPDHRGRHG